MVYCKVLIAQKICNRIVLNFGIIQIQIITDSMSCLINRTKYLRGNAGQIEKGKPVIIVVAHMIISRFSSFRSFVNDKLQRNDNMTRTCSRLLYANVNRLKKISDVLIMVGNRDMRSANISIGCSFMKRYLVRISACKRWDYLG